MEGSQFASISPSFNSYSSPNLARIAAGVAEEFRHQSGSDFGCLDNSNPKPPVDEAADDGGGGEDDSFEFAFVCKELESSPISADEIFSNGQIRPAFPLFNTDLVYAADVLTGDQKPPPPPPPVRLPLGRLLMEDREPSLSCSSSETEELEKVPPETYCVWNPSAAAAAASRRRCKKSSSTGTSSKRWKLRDLLFRSNSDGGKDALVFLTASLGGSSRRRGGDVKVTHSNTNSVEKITFGDFIASEQAKPEEAADDETPAAEEEKREALPANVKSKKKGEERRRSIVALKQEVVGFFSNMNSGLSRNVHPF